MEGVLPVLIVIGLGATVLVLAVGVAIMFRGGEVNRKYGNKLMRARVALQGLTLLLILAAFLILGRG